MSTERLGSEIFDMNPIAGAVWQALTSVVAATTGTTNKTDANTTPASTDGTQIWSQVITPNAASSRIEIQGSVYVDHGTSGRRIILAIFRGTVCIGVCADYIVTTGQGKPIPINIVDSPASVAAQTYTIRCFANNTGTWYVGQETTALYSGMLAKQSITVRELA